MSEPEPNGDAPQVAHSALDAEIKRLAALSEAGYERERDAAAKKLGFRVTVLDKLVSNEKQNGPALEADAL